MTDEDRDEARTSVVPAPTGRGLSTREGAAVALIQVPRIWAGLLAMSEAEANAMTTPRSRGDGTPPDYYGYPSVEVDDTRAWQGDERFAYNGEDCQYGIGLCSARLHRKLGPRNSNGFGRYVVDVCVGETHTRFDEQRLPLVVESSQTDESGRPIDVVIEVRP